MTAKNGTGQEKPKPPGGTGQKKPTKPTKKRLFGSPIRSLKVLLDSIGAEYSGKSVRFHNYELDVVDPKVAAFLKSNAVPDVREFKKEADRVEFRMEQVHIAGIVIEKRGNTDGDPEGE